MSKTLIEQGFSAEEDGESKTSDFGARYRGGGGGGGNINDDDDDDQDGSDVDHRSWLCSPVFAPDELLKKLPPTYIAAAGFDPLLDDSIDFDTRIRRAGVQGECVILRTLPHAFMNVAKMLVSLGRVRVGDGGGGGGGGGGKTLDLRTPLTTRVARHHTISLKVATLCVCRPCGLRTSSPSVLLRSESED